MSFTPVDLPPFIRGDTYRRTFTLTGVTAIQCSSIKYTLRTSIPASTVVTDDDSGVVDKASVATGEITFAGNNIDGTVLIPHARTKTWATGKIVWDLEVVVTATGEKETIGGGTQLILGDVTRS